MFTIFDKNAILEVEKDIIREMSGRTGTAYTLPFQFSKPIRQKSSVYKVQADAIKINGIYYPPEIFMCVSDWWEKPVLVLEPVYDSLGNCHILPDGGWAFGFDMNEMKKSVGEYAEKISFEIDAKKKTFKMVDELESSKQSQPGNV